MIFDHSRALLLRARSRAPCKRKFGYLCIQIVLVLTKPPITTAARPPLHVNGCEIAHLLARGPRPILALFNLVLNIHVMGN